MVFVTIVHFDTVSIGMYKITITAAATASVAAADADAADAADTTGIGHALQAVKEFTTSIWIATGDFIGYIPLTR